MKSAELQAQELVLLAIRNKVAIDRKKLVRYARIKVAADMKALNRGSADEHAKAAIYYRVATFYGLDYKKLSPKRIRQAAARGREAMNRIGQSAEATRIALSRLTAITEKNKNSTPPHFKKQLAAHGIPQMLTSVKRLEREIQVHLEDQNVNPELAIKEDSKLYTPRLNRAEQTLVWWDVAIPKYPGKIVDMYDLALVWHLTEGKDIEPFRVRLAKLKKKAQFTGPTGRTVIEACPV